MKNKTLFILLLTIPFFASCEKEDNLQIKDLEVVQEYPTIVYFKVSMPDGSLRTFYSTEPTKVKDLVSGIPPYSNEPTGKVLYYDGFDIHLTVIYSFVTKDVCHLSGSIDGHTFIMNIGTETINICGGPQNVPAIITLQFNEDPS
jgi:hypothetical protein